MIIQSLKLILQENTYFPKHAVRNSDLPLKLSEAILISVRQLILSLNHKSVLLVFFFIDTLAWIEYYGINNTILIAAKAIAA